MIGAILLWENDSRYCPVTNLYRCADGPAPVVPTRGLMLLGTIFSPSMARLLKRSFIQVSPLTASGQTTVHRGVSSPAASACVVDADGTPPTA